MAKTAKKAASKSKAVKGAKVASAKALLKKGPKA